MPSPIHQGLLYLVKRHPELVFSLARNFDDPIPESCKNFEAAANELPEPARLDNIVYADHVVAAVLEPIQTRSGRRKPVRVAGLALEIQTYDDKSKYYSWLTYAAGVRRLFECRGWTMVFAPDPGVRRRAQKMFLKEPRASPWFVDPSMLPPITQWQLALADIPLAVLTSVFQARSEHAVPCACATLEALAKSDLDFDERRIYHDLVLASLKQEQLDQIPQEIRDIDEADPLGPMELTGAYYVRGHREGHEAGLEEGVRKGVQEGLQLKARQVLQRVLRRRGLEPAGARQQQIERCTDLPLLEHWLDQALTARTLAEVFDPPPPG
ncbi:hypothetical protein DB30_03737 [Enhygromyxa salina]|uniref:DUF4351 domain-containing protein n=1 Tax=Enhygromyxa salina TaxID=215803 RepID=A0A0C2D657_9BACT|nr:hypothetical protein [Enhygromyxa salina]KIG17140.1 hypothetical protein DB30_03737 [Enhygromyxa salina]